MSFLALSVNDEEGEKGYSGDVRTPLTDYVDAQRYLCNCFRHGWTRSSRDEIHIDTMGSMLLPVRFRMVALPVVCLGHMLFEIIPVPLVVLMIMILRLTGVFSAADYATKPRPKLRKIVLFVSWRLASTLAPWFTLYVVSQFNGQQLVNDNVVSGVELLSPLLCPALFIFWNTMEFYISSVAKAALQSVWNEIFDSGVYHIDNSKPVPGLPPICRLADYMLIDFPNVQYRWLGESFPIFDTPLHLIDERDLRYVKTPKCKCLYKSYSRSAPENGRHANTRAGLFQGSQRKASSKRTPIHFYVVQWLISVVTASIAPIWMMIHHKETYRYHDSALVRVILPILSFVLVCGVSVISIQIVWQFADHLWLVKIRMLSTLYMSSTGFGRRLLYKMYRPILENLRICGIPLHDVDWQLKKYSSRLIELINNEEWLTPFTAESKEKSEYEDEEAMDCSAQVMPRSDMEAQPFLQQVNSGQTDARSMQQSVSRENLDEDSERWARAEFVRLLHGMQATVRIKSMCIKIHTLDIPFFSLMRQWGMIDHIIENLRVGALLNGMFLFIVMLMSGVGIVAFKWQGITCVSVVAAWLLLLVFVITSILFQSMVSLNTGRREMTLSVLRAWKERLANDKCRFEASEDFLPFSEARQKLQLEFASMAQPLNNLFDRVSSGESAVSIGCDCLKVTVQTRNRLLLTLLPGLGITLWTYFTNVLKHEAWFQNYINNSTHMVVTDFGWTTNVTW